MYEEEIHFGELFLIQFEMVLEHLTLVTLTFEPMTPESIGFICYPSWEEGRSRSETDGQRDRRPTNRPTCAKQYALSSSREGGGA